MTGHRTQGAAGVHRAAGCGLAADAGSPGMLHKEPRSIWPPASRSGRAAVCAPTPAPLAHRRRRRGVSPAHAACKAGKAHVSRGGRAPACCHGCSGPRRAPGNAPHAAAAPNSAGDNEPRPEDSESQKALSFVRLPPAEGRQKRQG